jgi:penicillin amidase
MRSNAKIVPGIIFTILIVFLATLGVGYMLVRKSFPTTTGSLSIAGLQQPVEIVRDAFGVPHIVAQTEYDAYFAVGFVHAQDRLWQMEMTRRAGLGRLAEVLGDSAVKFDRMFRTLGLSAMASRLVAAMDSAARAALIAYANGVNAFIHSHHGSYPIELDMVGIEPVPWTVEHSALISRLMAWELNHSRWMDIVLWGIVERVGKEKAADVFPGWREGAPLIVAEEPSSGGSLQGAFAFLDTDLKFRQLFGIPALSGGSNAWAVGGSKSVTGKPILANDPHLLLFLPGRWYELHVTAPGLDVQGATIAGVPFVVIGRNRSVAWGLTNAMVDDQDFYFEDVDSLQHPTRYRVGNEWRPLTVRTDTILVKGSSPILYTSYHTHRGPIINRIEPSAELTGRLLSIRWVAHDVSDEAGSLYRINRAAGWEDFRQALTTFGAPAQNFVYADAGGTIGYQLGGRIPLRSTKGPTLPYPGWREEFDWRGYVSFEELPHVLNPPAGFIATANNKVISDSYPFYISDLWEPPWRITRIQELLTEREKFSPEDVQRLQLDLFSVNARELVPIILTSFPDSLVMDEETRTALTYLRNWTGYIRADDVSPTLFETFLVKLTFNTLYDEMGDTLFHHYVVLSPQALNVVTNLVLKGTSGWFDDVRTPEVETRDAIVRKSLRDALGELRRRLNGELKEWRWGRVHTVTFSHVLGAHPLLGRIFNVGPFPLGGSHATISKGDFLLTDPFRATVAPSTRQIFDLADPNNNRAVTPAGQSGQLFHRHYDDQVSLWLNGGYRMVPMDVDRVKQGPHERLMLEPRR